MSQVTYIILVDGLLGIIQDIEDVQLDISFDTLLVEADFLALRKVMLDWDLWLSDVVSKS